MVEATSCGGIVIFHGKILLLYKNYRNRYEGWVLPKGTVEAGESFETTALREVKEETGVSAHIVEYIGKSEYTFNAQECPLVSDERGELLFQTAARRVFYGFRLLQVSRGMASSEICK